MTRKYKNPTNMTGLPSLSKCQGSDSDMECNGKLSMRRAISILGVDMLELIFSPHLNNQTYGC